MKLPSFLSSNNSKKIKLSDSETLFVVDSLATMLASGIPILEAFTSIVEDTNSKNTKLVINEIIKNITSGKSLSESFSIFPETFDSVFISIVKSGEASGKLDLVLQSAANSLKNSIETKGNIKSALFYPMLIIGVLLLVSYYVFSFSLPTIAKVFFDLKIKLPIYSSIVLHIALWFGTYKYFIALGFVVFAMMIIYSWKIKSVRKQVFRFLNHLPIISTIVRFLDLARFTQTTALLLSAGVPIIDALNISKNVVITDLIKKDIEAVRIDLTEGKSLSESMKLTPKSFPSLLRRVVGVGEETGNLDKSMGDISHHYEKKFTDIIKNLTVIIEPILIIFVAILVALVLVSVVLPIYQGIGSINRQ